MIDVFVVVVVGVNCGVVNYVVVFLLIQKCHWDKIYYNIHIDFDQLHDCRFDQLLLNTIIHYYCLLDVWHIRYMFFH